MTKELRDTAQVLITKVQEKREGLNPAYKLLQDKQDEIRAKMQEMEKYQNELISIQDDLHYIVKRLDNLTSSDDTEKGGKFIISILCKQGNHVECVDENCRDSCHDAIYGKYKR